MSTSFKPAFALDLIRNASSGTNFQTIPPPLLPAQLRSLSTSFQASTDTYSTTGTVMTYYPFNDTLNPTTFADAFYSAFQDTTISTFRVQTGTYTLLGSYNGFHLQLNCNFQKRSPFEVDFGNSTYIFTVRRRASLTRLHGMQFQLAHLL
jgi:hypothetical protein